MVVTFNLSKLLRAGLQDLNVRYILILANFFCLSNISYVLILDFSHNLVGHFQGILKLLLNALLSHFLSDLEENS